MMKTRYIFITIILGFATQVFSQGGIDTNFGFNVQANVPADLRETIATDADTANVAFKHPNMLVRSDASDRVFEWTGSKWVAAGRSYMVATAAELSGLPQRTGWAYVSGEDAWYYWNGSAWVENVVAPSDLAQEGANNLDIIRWNDADQKYEPQALNLLEKADTSFTITVCNDTCDYSTLNQAFEFASNFYVTFDSTINANSIIKICKNGDGSYARLQTGLELSGGDYSYIEVTSDDTLTYYTGPGNLFNMTGCKPPFFNKLHIRGPVTNIGAPYGQQRAFECKSVSDMYFQNVRIDSFDQGTFLNTCTGLTIWESEITNCTVNMWVQNTTGFFRNFKSTGSYDGSIRAIRNCMLEFVNLETDTVARPSGRGVFRGMIGTFNFKGGILPTANISTINDGTECIFYNYPAEISEPGWGYNKFNRDGPIFLSPSEPAPFQESTTAAEPAASSGIRFYWNTDCNCLKETKDGSTWTNAVPPDTLIVHLPVLEYTGDANDTIPNLFDKYLTAHAAGWGNRKVVALEVTTPDTTSVDLHFWFYEYDAVDNTNSLFLPDPGASESYFTLPAGQTNRRFQLGDNFFPGSPVDVEDSKMLDFRLLNGNGSPGIDDLVGEGSNGIYLTIYLIE